jgi:hypothetical protein
VQFAVVAYLCYAQRNPVEEKMRKCFAGCRNFSSKNRAYNSIAAHTLPRLRHVVRIVSPNTKLKE